MRGGRKEFWRETGNLKGKVQTSEGQSVNQSDFLIFFYSFKYICFFKLSILNTSCKFPPSISSRMPPPPFIYLPPSSSSSPLPLLLPLPHTSISLIIVYYRQPRQKRLQPEMQDCKNWGKKKKRCIWAVARNAAPIFLTFIC